MSLSDLDRKYCDAIKELVKVGEEYAEAKAKSWHLQEMRKVCLSNQMKDMDGSVADREVRAKASKEYIKFLDGIREAIKEEQIKRAYVKKVDAEIDYCRSNLSMEKSKMELR